MHVIFKMVKNIITFDLCLQTQTPPPPQKVKLDFLKIIVKIKFLVHSGDFSFSIWKRRQLKFTEFLQNI